MEKPELILHIGDSKCGSTAIQRFLFRNQQPLAQQRAYLFGADLKTGKEAPVSALPNPTLSDSGNWALAAESIRRAATLAEPGDRYVLTAEVLSQPQKADFVNQFHHKYDVTVIHYIRRQDDWCYSAWKQWQLKRGVSLDSWIEKCATTVQPFYMKAFRSYERIGIDPRSYRMRILDGRFLHCQDLIADFCNEAKLDIAGLEQNSARVNPNFDRALLEVFRAAEFMFIDSHDNRPFNWVLNNLSREAIQQRGTLTAEQRRRIMSAHREQNEAICETFFSDMPDAFWAAFGENEFEEFASDDSLPPTEQRLLELERKVEDTRRALGFMLDFLIRKNG